MGFRYRKSFGSGPFRVNFSKSGIGYSVGTKGFRYTKKAGGGTRTTASIPGTGISYVKETGKQKKEVPAKKNKKNNHYLPKQNTELLSETFRVAGVNYYPEAIKNLVRTNPTWNLSPEEIFAEDKIGQKIYRFKFITSPVQLIPEPENPHESNAVAVLIAGQKVGYVPKETAPLICSILKKGTVQKIVCGFIGGQYKIVDDNLDVVTNKSSISITVKITYTSQAFAHTPQKSNIHSVTLTEVLLAWFLGFWGAHKFYRKKKGIGFLYLFTMGLFCIGWLGDALYLTSLYSAQRKGTAATKKQKFRSYTIAVLCTLVIGSCGNNDEPLPNQTEPITTETQSIQTETFTDAPTELFILPTETATPTITIPETEHPLIETEPKPVDTTPQTTPIIFTSWPQTIGRNETGTVTIQGAPNTEYSITVMYKSGPSEADGLENKMSNDSGIVSWNWKVGPRTSPGTYYIRVHGGGTSEQVEYTINN